MFTSLTLPSKSNDRRFICGYRVLIRFSTPLATIWFAIHPNGCRLTTLFTPLAANVAISPGRSHPSPKRALSDMITALQSGRYDIENTAVAISQTGGQCRASNYISLIKKALVEAGYANVPVISVAPGSGLKNDQPGFKIPWRKLLRSAVGSVIFTDCLARLYDPAAAR